jgi:hypothetical protein
MFREDWSPCARRGLWAVVRLKFPKSKVCKATRIRRIVAVDLPVNLANQVRSFNSRSIGRCGILKIGIDGPLKELSVIHRLVERRQGTFDHVIAIFPMLVRC